MEKYLWKGQLADLKQQYHQLELEVSSLVINIRTLLNPYEEDVTHLPVKEIRVLSSRLEEVVQEMREIKIRIKKLEEALG